MLLYEVAKPVGLDQLEDLLAAAFASMVGALQEGEPVVVAVDDEDLQGVAGVARAALAHGLLGLCRALAIEGLKEGWTIAMLSCAEGVAAEERARWIEALGLPGAATGSLLRLGGAHLGRLPA